MLLGKRPRPSMRRTTSMTGLTVDPKNMETSSAPLNLHHNLIIRDEQNKLVGINGTDHGSVHITRRNTVGGSEVTSNNNDGFDHQKLIIMSNNNIVSPSSSSNRNNQRRNSGDFAVETAHFLRSCGLCKRRLVPGRDIFMYRGDTAFCSLECRQQQMNHDERKEKCSWSSKKETSSTVATVAGSEASSNGETVAAA